MEEVIQPSEYLETLKTLDGLCLELERKCEWGLLTSAEGIKVSVKKLIRAYNEGIKDAVRS
jgi:hypothetical protein